MQIIGKSRLSLKNDVVVKQKRILHEVTLFDIPLDKFLALIETVSIGRVTCFTSFSSVDVQYSYTYQGNVFSYFLTPTACIQFLNYADENNIKVIKHEI